MADPLRLLRQDLGALAAAVDSDLADTDEIGYAILRASRRVGTIAELRHRIRSGG